MNVLKERPCDSMFRYEENENMTNETTPRLFSDCLKIKRKQIKTSMINKN